MDRAFPLIKSTAVLPLSGIKSLRPYQASPTAKSNLPSKRSGKNLSTHQFIPAPKKILSSSRLPPLPHPSEGPSITPAAPNLYLRNNTNRRSVSNTVIPKEPKNVIRKLGFKTKIGSIAGVPKAFNQDAFIIHTGLLSTRSDHFFAVCDGHGSEGHQVSSLIQSSAVQIIEKKLIRYPPLEALHRSIEEISKKVLHSNIDTSFSGSTFVGVLIISENLYCFNIGDSRAVIGNNLHGWASIELTKDHKPNRKDEADRIISKGGRIAALDQGGPLRIWYVDKHFPGLAMTRSIGDKASRQIGLTSEPEIMERTLSSYDQFIIIASDGLWEFISNKEAVETVGKLIDQGCSERACETLLKNAVFQWNINSNIVDDITILVLFLSVE